MSRRKVKFLSSSGEVFVSEGSRKEILFYTSQSAKDEDAAIWLNSEFFAQAFSGMLDITLKK